MIPEALPLPNKYEVKKINENHAQITVEPCYPGYGTTVGNALRRVLLSSLSGAAVTDVKIKGVTHEFSTVPGVKEDVVGIILNIKLLRFKLHNAEESKTTLKIKGERKVKAKDIQTTSELEVINPEAHIATLTDKNSELDMELTVRSGRGYLPVENVEKKKLQLGTIAIDAIFTPVRTVNFRVENVRVGQITNYDRLILDVTTDGTIAPEEALQKAAQLLVDHFAAIVTNAGLADMRQEQLEKKEEKKEAAEQREIEIKKQPGEEATKAEAEKPKKKRGRPKKE